jgi:hypothetical protein
MSTQTLLAAIDLEIVRLRKVRKLLEAVPKAATKKSGKIALPKIKKPQRQHNLTPEGRARISASTKRRWAALKKAQADAPRLTKIP